MIDYFNATESDILEKDFCEIHIYKDLIKERTCLKNLDQPKCMDLNKKERSTSFRILV